MAIKLYYGWPGQGKTTLMHDEIAAQAHVQRFFIVDHANEWSDPNAPHWRGKAPPLTTFEQGQEVPQDLPETGVFIFQGWEPTDVAELVNAFGNTVYVDDEIDITARRKGWDTSPLRKMVHQGRHLPNAKGEICEVHIMGACRRPQNLHTDITDICDEFYIFKVRGKRTIERLQQDSLVDDGEEGRIMELPKFHFKHFPSNEWLTIPPIGDGKELAKHQAEIKRMVDEDERESTVNG